MASRDPQKPNIIFILSDDQGPWAVGYAGNDEVKTPNIDNLARMGISFTNCYCTSPVCSPARASLLTGTIPSNHGIHDWLKESEYPEKGISYLAEQIGYTDYLNENGYVCGISGKWHLGNSILPQHGFSHWYVHQKGGGDYYHAPMIRNGQPTIEDGYITDLITDDSLAFMGKQIDHPNPFYAAIHYTAPHAPWINQHPKEYVQLYDDCLFETCPQETKHPWARFSKDPNAIPESVLHDPKEHLKGYYGSISAMDDNIGRILKFVEHEGLVESTLICFMSDNGFSCGQHGFWGKGNGTYPLNMYESSVKVPALMCQPGRIPAGVVENSMVAQYDFMPTLLNYVKIPYEDEGKPGRDLGKLIQGKSEGIDDRAIIIHCEYGPVRMIRTNRWKFIQRYPDGPDELYDMEYDPKERCNLCNDPDKNETLESLKEQMNQWFDRYMSPGTDGKYLPVYGEGQLHKIDGFIAVDEIFVQ